MKRRGSDRPSRQANVIALGRLLRRVYDAMPPASPAMLPCGSASAYVCGEPIEGVSEYVVAFVFDRGVEGLTAVDG